MPLRPLTSAALVAAAFSLSFLVGSGNAEAYTCEAQVNQVLTERGITQDKVQSVKVVRRTGGARSPKIYNLDA